MANQYYWDLGFNFNSSADLSNPKNQPYLDNGFVLDQSNNSANVNATPKNLSVGDTIGFNVFNTTPEVTYPDKAMSYSITNVTFTFTDLGTGLAASPFAGANPLTIASTPMKPSGYGWSTYLSGVQAPQAATQSTSAQKFPIYNCIAPLAVENPGTYLVTFSVTVQGPSGPTVEFFADPEMSVGTGGTQ